MAIGVYLVGVANYLIGVARYSNRMQMSYFSYLAYILNIWYIDLP